MIPGDAHGTGQARAQRRFFLARFAGGDPFHTHAVRDLVIHQLAQVLRIRPIRCHHQCSLQLMPRGHIRVLLHQLHQLRVPLSCGLHQWEERILLVNHFSCRCQHSACVIRRSADGLRIDHRDLVTSRGQGHRGG